MPWSRRLVKRGSRSFGRAIGPLRRAPPVLVFAEPSVQPSPRMDVANQSNIQLALRALSAMTRRGDMSLLVNASAFAAKRAGLALPLIWPPFVSCLPPLLDQSVSSASRPPAGGRPREQCAEAGLARGSRRCSPGGARSNDSNSLALQPS